MTDAQKVSPAAFEEMCRRHDLTYAYSDDPRYWNAGDASMRAILKAADQLGHDIAVPIWNKVVRERCGVEWAAKPFLWEHTPHG